MILVNNSIDTCVSDCYTHARIGGIATSSRTNYLTERSFAKMKHLSPITKSPAMASSGIPTSVLITFLSAILDALIVVFTAKELSENPLA